MHLLCTCTVNGDVVINKIVYGQYYCEVQILLDKKYLIQTQKDKYQVVIIIMMYIICSDVI